MEKKEQQQLRYSSSHSPLCLCWRVLSGSSRSMIFSSVWSFGKKFQPTTTTSTLPILWIVGVVLLSAMMAVSQVEARSNDETTANFKRPLTVVSSSSEQGVIEENNKQHQQKKDVSLSNLNKRDGEIRQVFSASRMVQVDAETKRQSAWHRGESASHTTRAAEPAENGRGEKEPTTVAPSFPTTTTMRKHIRRKQPTPATTAVPLSQSTSRAAHTLGTKLWSGSESQKAGEASRVHLAPIDGKQIYTLENFVHLDRSEQQSNRKDSSDSGSTENGPANNKDDDVVGGSGGSRGKVVAVDRLDAATAPRRTTMSSATGQAALADGSEGGEDDGGTATTVEVTTHLRALDHGGAGGPPTRSPPTKHNKGGSSSSSLDVDHESGHGSAASHIVSRDTEMDGISSKKANNNSNNNNNNVVNKASNSSPSYSLDEKSSRRRIIHQRPVPVQPTRDLPTLPPAVVVVASGGRQQQHMPPVLITELGIAKGQSSPAGRVRTNHERSVGDQAARPLPRPTVVVTSDRGANKSPITLSNSQQSHRPAVFAKRMDGGDRDSTGGGGDRGNKKLIPLPTAAPQHQRHYRIDETDFDLLFPYGMPQQQPAFSNRQYLAPLSSLPPPPLNFSPPRPRETSFISNGGDNLSPTYPLFQQQQQPQQYLVPTPQQPTTTKPLYSNNNRVPIVSTSLPPSTTTTITTTTTTTASLLQLQQQSRGRAATGLVDPNAKLDLCCRKQSVSAVCQQMCNFDTFTDKALISAVLSNHCPAPQLGRAFDCATSKHDHSECCRRSNIHLYNGGQCMPFCTTNVPTPPNVLSYFSCLQVFEKIKQCYKEHLLQHPSLFGD